MSANLSVWRDISGLANMFEFLSGVAARYIWCGERYIRLGKYLWILIRCGGQIYLVWREICGGRLLRERFLLWPFSAPTLSHCIASFSATHPHPPAQSHSAKKPLVLNYCWYITWLHQWAGLEWFIRIYSSCYKAAEAIRHIIISISCFSRNCISTSQL